MLHSLPLRRSLCASVASFLFANTVPAVAQTAPRGEPIEEIVVTADFRQRTTGEMPSSITVIEDEEISALAVQHFEELVNVVPNLNWSGDGHRARFFQIRGVGELEQYEGAPNPSVGFIIDDIDFSGIGAVATLFDVGRVEVLRGSQGTRYGANAIGGLIYVQSAEPTEEWEGRFELSGAQDDAWSAGVAAGGPLDRAGTLAFRASAHRHESDGFRENPFLGRDDTNGRNETSLRAKLSWQPGNEWEVGLAAMLADIDDGYDAFAIDNSLTVLSDKPGRDAQRSFGSALRAEWSGARRFELTSITSYADSDMDFGFDADWGNPEAWAPFTYDFIVANDRRRETLSQEFRLASTDAGRLFGDSTDWLLGLYVLDLDERLTTTTRGVYEDPLSGFSDAVEDTLSSRFEALNVAVFGQLNVEVGEAGEVGLGLRVENRDTDYTDSAGLALGPGETMVGGELSYTHTFEDGLTAFVALSRG